MKFQTPTEGKITTQLRNQDIQALTYGNQKTKTKFSRQVFVTGISS